MADLPKTYEPKDIEPRWYAEWTARGYFHADAAAPKAPFAIVIPPPNVTGLAAHGARARHDDRGHLHPLAAHGGLQRPLAAGHRPRRHRDADGGRARAREKEKKSRHDLGREAFVERVWDWRAPQRRPDPRAAQAARLLARLGARRVFTMDPPYSAAVARRSCASTKRGSSTAAKRLINWCPSCRTALSDLEVDYDEGTQGELYEFAYPLADGSGELVVATTRPETMLGDTAVAVHPDDPRYKAKIGKKRAPPVRRARESRSSPTRSWSTRSSAPAR